MIRNSIASAFNRWLYAGAYCCLIVLLSCSGKAEKAIPDHPLSILVQPFADIDPARVAFVTSELKKVYPHVKVLQPIDLPDHAFYPERNRYRADSLIRFLHDRTPAGRVTIGLTSKDISAAKGNIRDYAIMGLGYRPGNACIASAFRLNKNKKDEQLFKIAIHELGHTQGLKHCPVKTCFMRNAGGKNPTDEETGFCSKCQTFLMNKKWKFI
ncbi:MULTISPECIES: matrixin family metalloprotease [Chryseobacterium]|uniref:Archaemetzincin n=1 Tax=Chryseobacterium camelliae TaxID=1265445 RepID=A0ABU0TDX5_9FLAO|nr:MULTISPECIES: matrixin family metalloprotease [Chryseobacterium]MDT3406930.1 archaemetzincin [Pseudacidovorax intermedius]MDQ1095277.1 archaemetzincin [Chryseobacterium camelliae]MDQ1099215.1 archaemetzincin [Chryseobacterium sp. SORGH_AS_1048]MDR6086565.1 archaemetzincin [Chryseobacterium sp. SORGH_AS_0909]MDR6130935.1 archaemetzincin [Chryseobacterium sp. SORGH_AS_1175]